MIATVSGQTPDVQDAVRRQRVLVVHNRYQQRGGEDSVFEAETALLESHGHAVERLLFDNRELTESPDKLKALSAAINTVWSQPARSRLRQAIRSFKPEIVHFHNTFPLV